MKARSIKGSSAEEIKAALQQSMTDGFKPTLAIVFLSVKQDIAVWSQRSLGCACNSKQNNIKITLGILHGLHPRD